MKAKRIRQRAINLPSWLKIAALAVLALLTVIAVVIAASQARSADPLAGTVPKAAEPKLEKTTEIAPKPTVTPEAVVASAPVMRRLLAVHPDGEHLLRAEVGSCSEPVRALERSVDNGETWQQVSLANAGGVTGLLQLEISASSDHLAALGEDCAPISARSFIGGVDWEPASLQEVWFIDPTDFTVVHSPNGSVSPGCSVVGLSSAGARTIALCSDASVATTSDAGASWSTPVAVPGAAAVGVTPTSFVVASVDEPDCAGVRTRSFENGTAGEPGSCIGSGSAAADRVAVSGSGSDLYVWVGEGFFRSVDSGSNWS